jgi:ABC-type lipoprotein release transport system permease subunit
VTNLNKGIFTQTIENGVRMASGHIGIYHPKYQEDRRLGDTVPAGALMARLGSVPGVEALYPRLRVAGLVRSSRDSRPGGAIGLDFARERDANPLLNPKVLVAGKLPVSGNAVLLGDQLAKELGVKVGKKVVWMAQDASGEVATQLLRVSGLIHVGITEVDGGTVIMSRRTLAELIGRPDSAHEIAVLLKGVDRIPIALPAVRAVVAEFPDVEAMTWEQAMPGLHSGIKIKVKGQQFLFFILYLLVGIGTVNTLLMSVMERTREFGLLRAIGVGRRAIRRMVLLEALVLGVVGAIAGLGATLLVGLYTATKGIDLSSKMSSLEFGGVGFDPIMRSGWDIPAMVVLTLAMIGLTVLASIYPARWTLRIRPADAMRN